MKKYDDKYFDPETQSIKIVECKLPKVLLCVYLFVVVAALCGIFFDLF